MHFDKAQSRTGCTLSLFPATQIDEDFNYSNENDIVLIENNLSVGAHNINITAKSIIISPDATLSAKEITFRITERVFCYGTLACEVFRNNAANSYIAHQGNPKGSFKSSRQIK